METGKTVGRFAPSPSGRMHLGNLWSCLLAWLSARSAGGGMVLRLEDLDPDRCRREYCDQVMRDLEWLGLDWDGDVVFQFARAERHRAVAEELLAAGRAYHCYATAEELAQMRETARAEGRAPRYDGRWRDRDPAEAPEGVKPVIRLRAPSEGETVVDDAVQGRVTWANRDLDDLVLLRSDGTPTYMLAVVVDDHDMGVTQIIRGDDHLTNAARQSQIFAALGWEVPRMAHIPLIHGADGAKLSKRHGALGVEAYRDLGYLPEALRNYLVRLGWSHGDQEVFSTEEMVAAFDLGAVGRSAARFDFAKLANLNGLYIRQSADADLVAAIEKILPHVGPERGIPVPLSDDLRDKLTLAMPGLKERAKTLIELLDSAYYLYAARPLAPDDKARALLSDEGRARIAAVRPALEALPDWSAAATEGAVRQYAEGAGCKLGQVAQPLRAAFTGRTTSPPLFDVMAVLGRTECLARLGDQIPQG